MISDNKITEIYCKADDFCEIFQEFIRRNTCSFHYVLTILTRENTKF